MFALCTLPIFVLTPGVRSTRHACSKPPPKQESVRARVCARCRIAYIFRRVCLAWGPDAAPAQGKVRSTERALPRRAGSGSASPMSFIPGGSASHSELLAIWRWSANVLRSRLKLGVSGVEEAGWGGAKFRPSKFR